MNCKQWEERIALHAEGDLPNEERAAADRHLAECAGCREFLAELKQSLAALRSAHAEPLDASSFAVVRARVFEQIDRASGPARRLWWIGALAATAAASVVLLLPGPVPPPKMVAAPPPAPSLPLATVPPAPVVSPPARPVARQRKAAPRPEPLMVKLITDDPNVVIYWITN